MDYGEFREWVEFFSHEPTADLRGDIHTATLCAMLANINRDPTRRPTPFGVEDFLPDYWQERPQPSLADKFQAISRMVNDERN